MNELIKINYENSERPTVSGRELHDALKVKTAYKDWFPRMCEYGFTEGTDFNPLNFEQVQQEGRRTVKRNMIDHQLTINMAKELCMLQRNEIGKKFRQYFIQVEEEFNSPEKVMARALQIAKKEIDKLTSANNQLLAENKEFKTAKRYVDEVLKCEGSMTISQIAADYGMSGIKLNRILSELGVQRKVNRQWILYTPYMGKGYTKAVYKIKNNKSDKPTVSIQTYWTSAGRAFIHGVLANAGITTAEN